VFFHPNTAQEEQQVHIWMFLFLSGDYGGSLASYPTINQLEVSETNLSVWSNILPERGDLASVRPFPQTLPQKNPKHDKVN